MEIVEVDGAKSLVKKVMGSWVGGRRSRNCIIRTLVQFLFKALSYPSRGEELKVIFDVAVDECKRKLPPDELINYTALPCEIDAGCLVWLTESGGEWTEESLFSILYTVDVSMSQPGHVSAHDLNASFPTIAAKEVSDVL